MRVADIGEFGLIARVAAVLHAPPPPYGPGDDAAVVPAPHGALWASTDLLVEGRHFRWDWSTPQDVGRKAALVNCADMAAMGGRARALLVGLGVPGDTPVAVCEGIAAGLADIGRREGVHVVGGDTVAADAVVLAVTVLGDGDGRAAVPRAAPAGDYQLVLAGRLGWAAAGLAQLRAGRRDGPFVAAHRVPDPPLAAGAALADAGAAAMCDVSDGLLADVGHLARASAAAVQLDAAALAAAVDALAGAAAAMRVDPWDWVLRGGEDHALVAALPRGSALPAGATVIGAVRAGVDAAAVGVRIGPPAPDLGAPGTGGFDHFRSAP